MADHSIPDYELEETQALETAEQYRALFDDTRLQIVDLLLERAANIKELSDVLGKPKGTVGHHVSALEEAGLIHVVRTEKVRAIEAKFYGRTARTYLLSKLGDTEVGLPPDHFLTKAAQEYSKAAEEGHDQRLLSTLRYARIPEGRAQEWYQRMIELTLEFSAEERAGTTTYGLLVAMFPTDRPGFGEEE